MRERQQADESRSRSCPRPTRPPSRTHRPARRAGQHRRQRARRAYAPAPRRRGAPRRGRPSGTRPACSTRPRRPSPRRSATSTTCAAAACSAASPSSGTATTPLTPTPATTRCAPSPSSAAESAAAATRRSASGSTNSDGSATRSASVTTARAHRPGTQGLGPKQGTRPRPVPQRKPSASSAAGGRRSLAGAPPTRPQSRAQDRRLESVTTSGRPHG
jgi:hypothetical protein